MTSIILQARLDSTRLPRKALLDLAGKPVIVRVMENLAQVPVDMRILACDFASEAEFAPLAESCGFVCIAGPKEDVLERFCMVIRKTGTDVVLRATGDNPFLFAGAAEASLRRFSELQSGSTCADYFTFTGLPHGSGIEIFSARRLLEAAALTDSSYDHEHVGPALYNHTDRFVCIRETAPEAWYHPDARTTIDTPEDYERASIMASYAERMGHALPAPDVVVLDAWLYANRTLLLVPSVRQGQGTGHFARLCSLAQNLSPLWRCLLYIPEGSPSSFACPPDSQTEIIRDLPASASLVILDRFRSSSGEMHAFRQIGPVLALDEGGSGRAEADFLLDIIPGLSGRRIAANQTQPSLLPLPANRKSAETGKICSVLVLAGGENAASLAIPVARILAKLFPQVTVIDPSFNGASVEASGLKISGPVPALRETLFTYDLVVTHYGFTAFEALAAGCRVLLFSPTPYHYQLSRAQGFSVFKPGLPSEAAFRRIFTKGILVPSVISPATAQGDLAAEIDRIARGQSHSCPLCGNAPSPRVVIRCSDRTVARCSVCGMEYLLYVVSETKVYSRSYFFDEYRSQYGKTYLEDFESIRQKGRERLAIIDGLAERKLPHLVPDEKKILDIGCAYGPFLAAARDLHWFPYGTDISADAVCHVRDVLHIPAAVSAFPAPDSEGLLDGERYAAVTLWYVIEHFEDLEPVFRKIRKMLIPGGILAFATPSSAGVSGMINATSFYNDSPRDHYTIWNPRKVGKQLARYGFTVQRIVSTGHHPERFPFMKGKTPAFPLWILIAGFSRIFRLGDTFEVYAVKNGSMEDAE